MQPASVAGHAFRLSVGLIDAWQYHERAWLHVDEPASEDFQASLESVGRAVKELGDEATARLAAGIGEGWRQAFRGYGHLCRAVAYEMVLKGAGKESVGKFVSEAILRLYQQFEGSGVQGAERANVVAAIRKKLDSELKRHGALAWGQIEIATCSATRGIFYPKGNNPPQGVSWDQACTLFFLALEQLLAALAPTGIRSLKEPVPGPRWLPAVLEWEALRRSPVLGDLKQLGEKVLADVGSLSSHDQELFFLGCNVGVLAKTCFLPLAFVCLDPRIVGARFNRLPHNFAGGWYRADSLERQYIRSCAKSVLLKLGIGVSLPKGIDGLSDQDFAQEIRRAVSRSLGAVTVELVSTGSDLFDMDVVVNGQKVRLPRSELWKLLRVYAQRRVEDHEKHLATQHMDCPPEEGTMKDTDVIKALEWSRSQRRYLQNRLSELRSFFRRQGIKWDPLQEERGGPRRINCEADNIMLPP